MLSVFIFAGIVGGVIAVLGREWLRLYAEQRAAARRELIDALHYVVDRLPDKLHLHLAVEQLQPLAGSLAPDEVMPAEVLEYVSKWDSEWARGDSERRAIRLYRKLGSWSDALAFMRKEDGE